MAKAWVRALIAALADPPGWIPAWTLTAIVISLGIEASHHPFSEGTDTSPALEAFRTTADTYKVVLAIWLGYKGLGLGIQMLHNWLGVKSHAPQTEPRAIPSPRTGGDDSRQDAGPLA